MRTPSLSGVSLPQLDHLLRLVRDRRIHTPLRESGTWHWLNVIPGVVPKFNLAAVRLDSAQLRFREVSGRTRMDFPGAFAGFVLLFDLQTRELRRLEEIPQLGRDEDALAQGRRRGPMYSDCGRIR